jgi:hypothetical protein
MARGNRAGCMYDYNKFISKILINQKSKSKNLLKSGDDGIE